MTMVIFVFGPNDSMVEVPSSVISFPDEARHYRKILAMKQISEVDEKPLTSSLNIYPEASHKFGIWAPVYICTHWLRPRNYPLPPHLFGLIYEGAIGQPR
jgi:hypothetical protein